MYTGRKYRFINMGESSQDHPCIQNSLLIVTPIAGFCNCSMFCCAFLCVISSFAIISSWKRELVALLCLSSCCLVVVVRPFLTMPRVGLQFVVVVFPDHTRLLILKNQPQNAELGRLNIRQASLISFLICLKTIDHLSLKLLLF